MEVYQDEADGRIFNSSDIALFKKKSGECVTSAKKTVITRKFFIKTAKDVLLHLKYLLLWLYLLFFCSDLTTQY